MTETIQPFGSGQIVQDFLDFCFEFRNIVLDNSPHYIHIDSQIIMHQHIAES